MASRKFTFLHQSDLLGLEGKQSEQITVTVTATTGIDAQK
jgi:hypothetical protein